MQIHVRAEHRSRLAGGFSALALGLTAEKVFYICSLLLSRERPGCLRGDGGGVRVGLARLQRHLLVYAVYFKTNEQKNNRWRAFQV